jgi:hypothetical protein
MSEDQSICLVNRNMTYLHDDMAHLRYSSFLQCGVADGLPIRAHLEILTLTNYQGLSYVTIVDQLTLLV